MKRHEIAQGDPFDPHTHPSPHLQSSDACGESEPGPAARRTAGPAADAARRRRVADGSSPQARVCGVFVCACLCVRVCVCVRARTRASTYASYLYLSSLPFPPSPAVLLCCITQNFYLSHILSRSLAWSFSLFPLSLLLWVLLTRSTCSLTRFPQSCLSLSLSL